MVLLEDNTYNRSSYQAQRVQPRAIVLLKSTVQEGISDFGDGKSHTTYYHIRALLLSIIHYALPNASYAYVQTDADANPDTVVYV